MQEIRQLKDMCIQTSLREAQIVVPKGDTSAALAAQAIRERIRELGGSEVPVLCDSEADTGAQPAQRKPCAADRGRRASLRE